jgi:hypothetical protein
MLVRFTVGNFLSFNQRQSLAMLMGQTDHDDERLFAVQNLHLLKFAALFGANAAGKSNVVKAMAFAHRIILLGTSSITNIGQYSRQEHANRDRTSYFEFEIVVKDRLFAYGFELLLADRTITEEWLVELAPDHERTLFVRNTQTGTYSYDPSLVSEELRPRFEIYLSDMQSVVSVLFLHHIVTDKQALYQSDSQLSLLLDIHQWFVRLTLANPTSSLSGYSAIAVENPKELGSAITHFATGISKVRFTPISRSLVAERVPLVHQSQFEQDVSTCLAKQQAYRLQIGPRLFLLRYENGEPHFFEISFEHDGQEYSYEEESDGTRRLFDLLSVMVTAQPASVLVVDEIDRSLHPQLTLQFIRTYLQLASVRDLQLIITTHESHLLDLELLRRDEIFFVEKDGQGSSVIYPFDQFQEHFDNTLEEAYLNGRYGGVPRFSSMYVPQEVDV